MNGRTDEIEKRIDKDVAGAIAIAGSVGGAISIAPRNMGELMEFAKMMAVSGPCVRPAFRGNPGACLAVALTAFRCGGDPFAFANKAYMTKNRAGEEQLAWEAQLIHSMVNTSGVLSRRLRPTYEGQGPTRKCTIEGWVKGENESLPYESPTVQQIAVKNSPLWLSDTDQQLFYYSSRAWARRHVPEVLLGIYTPEEIREGVTIDMTPTQRPQESDGPPGFGRSTVTEDATPEPWVVYRENGEGIEFRDFGHARSALEAILRNCTTTQALDTAWENNADFETALNDRGTTLKRMYDEFRTELEPKGGDASAAGKPEKVDAPPPFEVGVGVLPRSELDPKTPEGAAVPRSDPINLVTGGPGATSPAHFEEGPITDSGIPKSAIPAGQSAARHDPFWDGASLKIDPPTVKKGGRYVIDWPRWPALILPKIRQAWSGQLVNSLWADNGENMDLYTQACGDKARDDLSWEFELARERFK